MNDDSKFYLQCRNLVVEVFKKYGEGGRTLDKKWSWSVYKNLSLSSIRQRRSTLKLTQSKSQQRPLTRSLHVPKTRDKSLLDRRKTVQVIRKDESLSPEKTHGQEKEGLKLLRFNTVKAKNHVGSNNVTGRNSSSLSHNNKHDIQGEGGGHPPKQFNKIDTNNNTEGTSEGLDIPLIYKDKITNKTVIKFEASSRDQKKVILVKQL